MLGITIITELYICFIQVSTKDLVFRQVTQLSMSAFGFKTKVFALVFPLLKLCDILNLKLNKSVSSGSPLHEFNVISHRLSFQGQR